MKLWTHQQTAKDFCADKPGAMLAMDMGTGKTSVALSIVADLEAGSTALVLCPKAVIGVWQAEVEKFFKDKIRVIALDRSTGLTAAKKAKHLRSQLEYLPGVTLVVVNYETARQPALRKLINGRTWELGILDESHKIKAPGGATSRMCATLREKCLKRICLTGTPTPHSPLDWYAQMRYLDTRALGTTFTRFRSDYAIMGGYEGRQVVSFKNLDQLAERLAPYAFQVKSDDVLDLPTFTHTTIPVELGTAARNAYGSLEHDFVAMVGDGVVTAKNALSKLLRLQQCTGGFLPVEGQEFAERLGSEKADALRDLLEGMGKEPVVVFCRFLNDLSEVKRVSDAYCELSGRANELKEWKESGGVLGVHIQAGGAGVDLTKAKYAVYYSLGFSLGEYEQSLKRVHRPGQTRPVSYYHLIATGTVDEKLYNALSKRREVVAEVLDSMERRTHAEDTHTVRSR
mgnify:CR=1 FL=1